MAKRERPSPEAEDDVLKAVEEAEALSAAETEGMRDKADVPPVVAEEPPRPFVEETPDLQPEPPQVAAPLPPPPVASAPRSSGFLGTVLGGVLAVGAGYALATFAPIPGLVPSQGPTAEEQAALDALSSRLGALEAAPAPDATLSDRLAALEQRPAPSAPDLSPLTDAVAALDARLTALEQRPAVTADGAPAPDVTAAIDSLRAEVAALKSAGAEATAGIEAMAAEAQARLAEAETQAAALKAEAEETARKARAAAAVGRVQAALESGSPFATALADLEGVEVPAILSDIAENGLPSRAALEDAFAPAARAALEASLRVNMGESWTERAASFLQSTTGARSLTPREGSDPDAILSRAEAAAKAGDLPAALTELQALPPEGLAAMADWITMAQQRLDAVSATAALAATVEG